MIDRIIVESIHQNMKNLIFNYLNYLIISQINKKLLEVGGLATY